MDIARLLNHDGSDDGPSRQPSALSTLADVASSSLPSRPAARRATRDQRRQERVQKLRARIEAYEFVVAHLPFVLRDLDGDPSPQATTGSKEKEEEPSSESQRIRKFLRHSIVLSQQAQHELAERAELLRLLKRHYASTAGLRKLVGGLVVDDWHWTCERWRALSHAVFEPFSEARCFDLVQETLRAIKSYKFPKDGAEATTTSFSTFGWVDAQTLDADARCVHFVSRKLLRGMEIEPHVDEAWSIYTDSLYQKYNIAGQYQVFDQILQRVTPDVLIVQMVENYPRVPKPIHTVAIAFRVKTETGYLIACRHVSSPRLESFMQSEGLGASGNFYWSVYDEAEHDETGKCTGVLASVAGYLGSEERAYTEHWQKEVFLSLLRAETKMLGSLMLPLESSSEEHGRARDQ